MQHRLKTLLAITGVLLIVMVLGLVFSGMAGKDKKQAVGEDNQQGIRECTGCHEMAPEVATWQVSSHSKIACTECHKVKPEDYQAEHDHGDFSRPIAMSEAIPNAVCEQCHSPNRVATVSGDLIIPHDRHNENGVACVTCHAGVVHGKIAERGLTGGKNGYDSWNQELARKVATRYYLEPNMWTCINCHKQLGKTRKCSACHSRIASLPSHDNPAWLSGHGKTARADIGQCTKCHVTPGSPVFVTPSTGDKAADFARAQEFCYRCHLKRPAMHENSMVAIHPGKAAQRGMQNCLTCHDPNPPKADPASGKVTGTYCNQCHWLPARQMQGNTAP